MRLYKNIFMIGVIVLINNAFLVSAGNRNELTNNGINGRIKSEWVAELLRILHSS